MFWLMVLDDSGVDATRTLLWVLGVIFGYIFVSSNLMYLVPKSFWPKDSNGNHDWSLSWLWPAMWPWMLAKLLFIGIKSMSKTNKLPKAKVIK